MAAKPRHKKSPAVLQHPIRVVPLHRPEAERVAAAVAPQLTYRGGPLLTSVEVFTVFWGAAWSQSPQSVVMKNMNLFFDYILASALMDQLCEYSVPGKNIGTACAPEPRFSLHPLQALPHRTVPFNSCCSRESLARIFPRPIPTRFILFFFLRA